MERRRFLAAAPAGLLFAGLSWRAWANKSSVTIEGPGSAGPGDEVLVRLTVSHRGNTPAHHTSWVSLKQNGGEIKRWEYSRDRLPEGDEFTLEHVVSGEGPLVLQAEAHCNIHGSAGASELVIEIS